METGKLVIKSDTSATKSFLRHLPMSILVAFPGIGGFALGAMVTPRLAIRLGGYRNAEMVYVMLKIGSIAFGALFIGLAIAIPFLMVREMKKCFIHVYEDKVCGVYIEGVTTQSSYVPFELTYDKIESVSANKSKVYIQIVGRTLQTKAFNADEIAAAISSRLSR